LASLLWRLRRAVAIETGLFAIQAQIVRDRRRMNQPDDPTDPLKIFYDLLRRPRPALTNQTEDEPDADQPTDRKQATPARLPSGGDPTELAICLLRLENFNPTKLELIGRYETRHWKQVEETVLILHSVPKTRPRRFRNRHQFNSAGGRDFSAKLHHRF
jgi:hypothetical protein